MAKKNIFNLDIIKVKPNINEFILFRKLAFESISRLTFVTERIKLRLGLSPLALFVSKYSLNRFYVCLVDKKIIGWAVFRLGKIRGLFVSQKHRGLGVGTLLINKICLDTKAKQICVIPFHSATGFYLKNGFRQEGKFFIKTK